jgi:hypothetical protein
MIRYVFAWLVCSLSMVALAQSAAPQYSIREDIPATGSMIRRNVVGPTRLPLNLTFEQLSAADRSILRNYYENIAEGDEPPFPTDGLRAIFDPLQKVQSKLLVSGVLRLVAIVDSDGVVQQVKTMGSPSPEMTRVAANVVMVTKFKPAICSGRPCAMEFPVFTEFRVQ